MSDKYTIELSLEMRNSADYGYIDNVYLTKNVEANFVPQHGMTIMIDEIPFKIKTIALAGLSGLSHVGYPVKGDWHLDFTTRNVSQRSKSQFQDRLNFFLKNGWKINK